MDRRLLILGFLTAMAMVVLVFPDGLTALVVVLPIFSIALFLFRRFTDEKDLITNIFLLALVVRLAFGLFVQVFNLREFFGGDAITYDFNGDLIAQYWLGYLSGSDVFLDGAMTTSRPGWGIHYVVGTLYYLFGRNIYLAQSFCAVFGAATAPMVYFCAKNIFHNKTVAKISAFSVALFPAFIIWSGQLLKDGLIVFLLVLAMTMVLQLQQKLSYPAIVILLLSMFGILTLRFYIFYMVAIAVVGSFIIGTSNSPQSIVRRTVVLVLMGVGLTYFGVIRNASSDFERYGNLDRLQNSRLDLAKSASSGFGEDIDVSTTSGALSAIPTGFAYLMLAPFPWQMSSLRQAVTLPEVLLWWAMIPIMLFGLWYTMRNRLRTAFPIVFFSLMLTLAYSIFQGNVGTAYRQRTQIQVFLFMFIAVGWTLLKERRENKKFIRLDRRRQVDQQLHAMRTRQ